MSSLLIIGLVGIFLTTRFGNSLSEAVAGNIAAKDIFKLISLKTLISIEDILPISLFIAIFTVVTNLVNHREWLALQSCGMARSSIYSLVFKVAVFTSLLVAISSLALNPVLETRLREIKEETKNAASIEGIKSGIFIKFGKSHTFYSEAKQQDGKKFTNPFVVKTNDQIKEVLRSKYAYIENQRSTGNKFAVFEAGSTTATNQTDSSFTKTLFDRYLIRIEQKKFSDHHKYLDFIPSYKLLDSDNRFHKIEFQWRLVPVILCIFMAFSAVAIAIGNIDKSWNRGLLITIAIYFIYSNSLGTVKSMLRKGELPLEVGFWPVHVLFFGVLTIILFLTKNKNFLEKLKSSNKKRS